MVMDLDGDPELADDSLIPNWWWFDHPEWEIVKGKYLKLACNYQLITDNLLDLSHLAYVHLNTLCLLYTSPSPRD